MKAVFALVSIAVFEIGSSIGFAQCDEGWLIPDEPPFSVDQEVKVMTSWDADGSGPSSPLLLMGLYGSTGLLGTIAAFDGNQYYKLGDELTGTARALTIFQGSPYAVGFLNPDYPPQQTSNGKVIRWDGSTWQVIRNDGFGVLPIGMCVHDGVLVTAKQFPLGGFSYVTFFDQWDGNQWTPLGLSSAASSRNGFPTELISHQDRLIATGEFTLAAGFRRIIEWNGSSWQPLGTGPNGRINCVLSWGSDLYVGGSFTSVEGLPAANVAKWDGQAWSALGTSFLPEVFDIINHGGELILAHNRRANGAVPPIESMCSKWNGSNWIPMKGGPTQLSFTADHPNVLHEHQGTLFRGGYFGNALPWAGKVIPNIAIWNGLEWQTTPWTYSAQAPLIGNYGNDLVAAANVGNYPLNQQTSQVARWDNSGWYGLGNQANDTAVVFEHSGLLVTAGRQVRVWNGQSTTIIGSTPTGSLVKTAATYQDNIVVGGDFTSISGVSVGHVGMYNGSVWSPFGIFDAPVHLLADFNGELIAAGSFSSVDGAVVDGFARFEETGWNTMDCPYGSSSVCSGTATWNGQLIIGGDLRDTSGTSLTNLAMWNGLEWSTFNPPLAGLVTSLCQYNQELYVGGTFELNGDPVPCHIVRWNGSGWVQFEGTIISDVGPRQMKEINGELVISGLFEWLEAEGREQGGFFSPRIARWGRTERPEIRCQPVNATTCLGSSAEMIIETYGANNSFAWQRNGQFIIDSENIQGASTPTLTVSPVSSNEIGGGYRCMITNGCGTRYSNVVAIRIDESVSGTGDLNSDQSVDAEDLGDFVDILIAESTRCEADMNHDGAVTIVADLPLFVEALLDSF